ncbi:MAG: methyltransferase domain-containing protein [Gammaproteobacteria bacterium]|nr:methyltransferase domain-containing protein [Gammaproteobacteria bacterium]
MTDRKDHWENIYQDKSPENVSWYQQQPSLSLQLIQNTQLALDEAIIDIGGGTSSLVDHLIGIGYLDISVLDISENALSRARYRLGDAAKKVKWYASDVTEFKAAQQYSLWHDRAVFHFLTAESDRRQYIRVLNQSLKPGGHLVIAAFAIGGPEKCSGLEVVQYDARKLSTELGEDYELVEETVELHITPSNMEQKFGYFRFIRKQHTI